MLFILLLSLLSLSYSFIQPNAQSKSLFFSNNVKMMNSELIETANTLISRGTLGTPWRLNDLFINLSESPVDCGDSHERTKLLCDINIGTRDLKQRFSTHRTILLNTTENSGALL